MAPAAKTSRLVPQIACLLIALAAFAVYANSLRAPFEFDDYPSILENLTLRKLWPLSGPLATPHGGGTTAGRPILNLSFALNYSVTHYRVWSFHLLNILIHAAAGLALFGIIRRTLASAWPPEHAYQFHVAFRSELIACACALLWVVHPLQTEAVTYIAQRAESLMGLFFLLTLYAFIRGARPPNPKARRRWFALAVLSCLLGTGTKEVIAVAPVLVLLYDRTFVSGGFLSSWKNHRRLYLYLAATWVPLGLLVFANGSRGGTSGFTVGVNPVHYWLSQFPAVGTYLKLTFWPHPLVFEYGTMTVLPLLPLAGCAILVCALLAGTAYLTRKHSPLGFLGVWFFAILAPTSFIPGAIQNIVEHRMYLPLAAILCAVNVGLWRLVVARGRRIFIAWAVLNVLAVAALGALTVHRNRAYRDDLTLWSDSVAKSPDSARAQNNLGRALGGRGKNEEALVHYRLALKVNPLLAEAHYNMALALTELGRPSESISEYDEAFRLNPLLYYAPEKAGIAPYKLGRYADAIRELNAALAVEPTLADAYCNLGLSLAALERYPEAVPQYARAVELAPDNDRAESNWGAALAAMDRPAEAVPHFERALALKPGEPGIVFDLAVALERMGKFEGAIERYRQAIKLNPGMAEARLNLGIVLCRLDRVSDGLPCLQEAVRIAPNSAEAQGNLGIALATLGRLDEAIASYSKAIALNPRYSQAHYNLGLALLRQGHPGRAREHFKSAVRIDPGFSDARALLDRLPEGLEP